MRIVTFCRSILYRSDGTQYDRIDHLQMARIGQQPQLDIGKPILIYVDIGARTEVVFHIRQPASCFHSR